MDHNIKSEVNELSNQMEPSRMPTTLVVSNSIANNSANAENSHIMRKRRNDVEYADGATSKRLIVKQEDGQFDENPTGSSSSDVPDLEQAYSYGGDLSFPDTSDGGGEPGTSAMMDAAAPVHRRRRAKEKQTAHYLKEGIFTRAHNDHAKYGAWYDKLIENGVYKKRWICKMCNVVYNPTCPLNCRNHIQNAHPEMFHLECSEEEVHASMIDWLLEDCSSLSMVHGEPFNKFVKMLIKYAICRSKNGDRNIDANVVPTHDHLRHFVAERLAQVEKDTVEPIIELMKSYGCGFSADFSRDFTNYFSIAAQYIDAEWELKKFVISFQHYPLDEYAKSAADIDLFCTNLLLKNGFVRDKNKFFLMKSTQNDEQPISDETSTPCVCDIGNSILREITTENSNLPSHVKTKCLLVGEEIIALQNFIMSIRRNEKIREKFGISLQTHALTKWLPGYKMVDGFLRNKDDLTAFMDENITTLSEYRQILEIDIMKNYADFSAYAEIGRIIKDFIQAFETSSAAPTANLIIAKIAKLYLAIEEILSKNVDEASASHCLASAAKASFLKKLPKFNKKLMFISAFCDPCARGQLEVICRKVPFWNYAEIVELFKHKMQSIYENEDAPRQSIDFVDFPFDEKLLPVTEELHAYESYRLFPFLNKIGAGSYSPLLFWKEHADKFPLMAKLARFYLAIPASATNNEKFFEQFRNVAFWSQYVPDEKMSILLALKTLQNAQTNL